MLVLGDRKLPCHLSLPVSKSYGLRALFLAAIDDREHIIAPIPEAADFQEAMRALELVGVKFKAEGNLKLHVQGRRPILRDLLSEAPSVYVGEGGATARFLIPFLSRDRQQYLIRFHPRLYRRPHEELFNFLTSVGVLIAKIDEECSWLIQGPMQIAEKTGPLRLDFKSSSQPASGILLAYADQLFENNLLFSFQTPSAGYLEMTRQLVDLFLQDKKKWEVPTDLSALPFAMTVALVRGTCSVKDFVGPDKSQPDFIIFKLWERLGGRWDLSANELQLHAPKMWSGFEINLKQNPDLAPPLLIWAALAQSESCFKVASYLSHKESHRLEQIVRLLEHYRISYDYNQNSDELIIRPTNIAARYLEYSCPDHRMTMTAYLMMKLFGGGTLEEEDSVKKSFPAFYSQFQIDGQNHSL